jgi:hypothetical protein
MSRTQVFAFAVLAALALYVFGTAALRMHEGRCVAGLGRRGLDCSYPYPRAPVLHPVR